MPNIKKNIFNQKYLNYLISRMDKSSITNLDEKLIIINDWVDFIKSDPIKNTKETPSQRTKTAVNIDRRATTERTTNR